MTAKKEAAPELTKVMLANGHTTSAGAGTPGDVVDLPGDEAAALIRDGYATRVA